MPKPFRLTAPRTSDEDDIQREIWKPVVGFEGFYEVSSRGNVRSCEREHTYDDKRVGTITRRRKSQTIAQAKRGKYRSALLSKNGERTSHLTHKLVIEAFTGPRPDGLEVRHLNGIASDNSASNLCYGTKLENAADRDAHGRTYRGEKHAWCRLSDAEIERIHSDAKNIARLEDLAAKYGISRTHAWNIKTGRGRGRGARHEP